jgi:hypothetical protein
VIKMKTDNLSIAVTADIIGSREKTEALRQVEAQLNRLNSSFEDSLAVQFALFRGDEIQGVLTPEANIPRLLRALRFRLRPLGLRIGVGIGRIEAGLDREYSWQMDGSAFHRSREALQKIARSRSQATCFAAARAEQLETVNLLCTLIDAIQDQWSEKQWAAVDAYDRRGTYALAARELETTPQSVNKHCRAARFKTIAEAELFLDARLKELI